MENSLQVHSNGPKDQKEASEGGEWMMKGLQALVKTDRWKKNDGSDFVFFDPHPGFTDGTSDKEFKTLKCHTSKKSMHHCCRAWPDQHLPRVRSPVLPHVAATQNESSACCACMSLCRGLVHVFL